MGIIRLNNIRVYAYHGCLPEEARIGSPYSVDLWIEADFSKAIQGDDLRETVDYTKLNQIVKDEMAIRSNLLEHAAQRILDRVLEKDSMVQRTGVKVSKINPPLGGDVETVSVELSQGR